MKKTILEIYALAVCFVAVIGLVVSLGIGAYSLIQISKPEFTMNSWAYEPYQSNDAFWTGCGRGRYCGDDHKKKERPSEAELTKQRLEAFNRAVASEQRDGAQALVKTTIFLIIDIVVLLVHWGLARRARVGGAA
jgi:hypothetical protein